MTKLLMVLFVTCSFAGGGLAESTMLVSTSSSAPVQLVASVKDNNAEGK